MYKARHIMAISGHSNEIKLAILAFGYFLQCIRSADMKGIGYLDSCHC